MIVIIIISSFYSRDDGLRFVGAVQHGFEHLQRVVITTHST